MQSEDRVRCAGPVTIVEFLLARLEEDEADAKQLIANFPSLTAAMHGPRQVVDLPKLEIGAARVLLATQAKRRIVERLAPLIEVENGCMCDRCLTMRDLAFPYIGHRDFRDEWRS